MNRYRWVDSGSDGMCGYVVIEDRETGERERLRWSIDGPITSQSAAADEAVRRLERETPRG